MTLPLVTFDAGQTLVDLDLDFLALRLAERAIVVESHTLAMAAPLAWRHYDDLVARGGDNAWQAFIRALLVGAGVADGVDELVAWLRREQPARNLWRRPITDMVALARHLRGRGVRVAVLSNSEGRLAELLEEVGVADAFEAIVDSGRIGLEKPDPRIFAYTRELLALSAATSCIHVGDSWDADVEGALASGWRAVWFRSRASVAAPRDEHDDRVAIADDVGGVQAALRAFGVVVD